MDWDSYFGGIKNYYATSKGEMWSFPYNSSTAMFYWNKDAWAKIGKTEAPKTWTEYAADLKALKAAGVTCGLAFDFDTWTGLEQFSAANGLPIASMNNGYDGLGAELLFNKTAYVQHMKDYKAWMDAGYAELHTNRPARISTRPSLMAPALRSSNQSRTSAISSSRRPASTGESP